MTPDEIACALADPKSMPFQGVTHPGPTTWGNRPAVSAADVIGGIKANMASLRDALAVDDPWLPRPAPAIPVPPRHYAILTAWSKPTYRGQCNAMERLRYEERRAARRGVAPNWMALASVVAALPDR